MTDDADFWRCPSQQSLAKTIYWTLWLALIAATTMAIQVDCGGFLALARHGFVVMAHLSNHAHAWEVVCDVVCPALLLALSYGASQKIKYLWTGWIAFGYYLLYLLIPRF